MKKICVVTTTRAEYGLLYPLLKEINNDDDLILQLVVSGTHLVKEFGYTKKEILKDGFSISKEIEMILATDTASSVSKSMGMVLVSFSDYLKEHRPDMGVILGDRYEMLAFAIAFVNEKIPIAHLNGGEVTMGALDDYYRHAITKLSTLHFTNCSIHRDRVIQMGEEPNRVFNVGDTCVDNIYQLSFLPIEELEEYLKIQLKGKKIILITFHPVTSENNSLEQIQEILDAIEQQKEEFTYIFTKANADEGGKEINDILRKYVNNKSNCVLVDSLGRERYLSLLNYVTIVMGNSSSGIYEVPFFKIPTINLGNRQQGRLKGKSVYDCPVKKEDIIEAINYVLSDVFEEFLEKDCNFWGNGTASQQIVKIIKEYLENKNTIESKTFYDLI